MGNYTEGITNDSLGSHRKAFITLGVLTLINIVLRTIIFQTTNLFYFADYRTYLEAVGTLVSGERISMLEGNYIMSISYLGYWFVDIFGNLNYFFALNILAGSLASLLISLLVFKVTRRMPAAVLSMVMLTLYTEYMVFSSVFYTPVLMILLLSILLWGVFYYYQTERRFVWIWSGIITTIIILSYTLKPELVFFPLFLFASTIIARLGREFLFRTFLLGLLLAGSTIVFYGFQNITSEGEHTISNSFIFFGHTDYGGDGGEGAFIYRDNEIRYRTNFKSYCDNNGIKDPDRADYNNFHWKEIIRYIKEHPIGWIVLQLKKFTRTFGVVPEGNSFKVLYTGIMGGRLWLTSLLVVVPVAVIITLFIIFFRISVFSTLIKPAIPSKRSDHRQKQNSFLYIYLLLFIYYIIATIFFGHYQERYRIPLMTCFIIPILALLISEFSWDDYFVKRRIFIRSIIFLTVFIIWISQAAGSLSNKDRLNNALENVREDLLTTNRL